MPENTTPQEKRLIERMYQTMQESEIKIEKDKLTRFFDQVNRYILKLKRGNPNA